MTLTFVEARGFTAAVPAYFGSDQGYGAFQDCLLADPERGDVMPGCGGLRKTRWRDPRRGKGARGGVRVIYLYVPDVQRVLLLDVYGKDEADDLSRDEKRHLCALAEAYRTEARQAHRTIGKTP